MELILWLLVSYYLADHLITDTAYAVRGLDPPRHKERMARIESGGKPSSRYQSGRNGASRFFAEAWHDAWDDAHSKRKQLRERRQAKKAEKDGAAHPGPAGPGDAAEPQPDGTVDTPGALRPQEPGQEHDDNVIPLATRTRRATVSRPSATDQAEPSARGAAPRPAPQPDGALDAPDALRPQRGQGAGTADPTVPPEVQDPIDGALREAAEPRQSVVHGGPSPYGPPNGERFKYDPYPDLHATREECAAHEASLDDRTRQALLAIDARLEAAEGAAIPITVTEEEALLQARGYPADVAHEAAEDLHDEARRRGGRLMAQKSPSSGRSPTTPDASAADEPEHGPDAESASEATPQPDPTVEVPDALRPGPDDSAETARQAEVAERRQRAEAAEAARRDPYPSLFTTPEEWDAHFRTLDPEVRRTYEALQARSTAADGAPIQLTVAEEAALYQARGYPPDVAQQAAEHGRRQGRVPMTAGPKRLPGEETGNAASPPEQSDQAHRQPAADGDPAQQKETQEGSQMSVMTSDNATGQPTGETAGLGSAIRFAEGMANSMRDAAARTETSIASLTGSEVGPGPIAVLQQAMEAATNAAAAYDAAKAELEKQVAVKDAYNANPDAGNKQFLQND